MRKDDGQSKLVGEVEKVTFNGFVKPPTDAIWNDSVCKCHGLSAQHQSIVDADPISDVWEKIIEYLDNRIEPKEKGVLVAWNGESCDLRWMYKLRNLQIQACPFPRSLIIFLIH